MIKYIWVVCLMTQVWAQDQVVFVHGFLRRGMNMILLERSFRKSGWDTENWTYPSREKTIEEHGADLAKRLAQIAKNRPNTPICFVTHSLGGLIVRSALNHPECPIEAKRGKAVLIAPPNQGAIIARKLHHFPPIRWIFKDKAGAQLMKTAAGGFNDLGQFPEKMPILVIRGSAGINPLIPGRNDGKVALQETALDTPHETQTYFAGHSWLCYSPSVIRAAKDFLNHSP